MDNSSESRTWLWEWGRRSSGSAGTGEIAGGTSRPTKSILLWKQCCGSTWTETNESSCYRVVWGRHGGREQSGDGTLTWTNFSHLNTGIMMTILPTRQKQVNPGQRAHTHKVRPQSSNALQKCDFQKWSLSYLLDYSSQTLTFEIFKRFSISYVFIWLGTTDNIFHQYKGYAWKTYLHIILTQRKSSVYFYKWHPIFYLP